MGRNCKWKEILRSYFGIIMIYVFLVLSSASLRNGERSYKDVLSHDAGNHSIFTYNLSKYPVTSSNYKSIIDQSRVEGTEEPRRNDAISTHSTEAKNIKRRKANHLMSSLKNHNFWERDFGQKLEEKIQSGPSSAFFKQEVFSSFDQYLDKGPFMQEIIKSPSNTDIPKTSRKRANIVLIMTDDLDVELGSLNYMPKLLRLLGEHGAMFSNSYTSTPMCCPSRSSMLTGMYIHNHEVYTNNQNCSSPLWQNTHEKRSFATYLRESGYKTGFFGKYLNRYNGSHVPAGWSEWVGLIGNSRYYNYSVNRNNRFVKYGNRYPQDYFPHVVTSDGINFIRRHIDDTDPYLLVMSYPAPHGPEDSAPEHSHKFFNASDHHTASYNYAPNPDKQWILQTTDRMGAMEMKFTDLLMTKRLQTLQSVDESITKIVYELQKLKQLENTYVFFTSDHGYHLGQFGLAKGKSMPFEFDIKVPFFVRGPGIKTGTILPQISLNIDLAPTFLDIGGVKAPAHMDGRSLLPIFEKYSHENLKTDGWRDMFLVESSGRVRDEDELLKKEQRTYEREKALSMSLNKSSIVKMDESGISLYTSKHERFQEVCKGEKFKAPCKNTQKWFCLRNGDRWRLKKCRYKSSIWKKKCICQSKFGFGTFNKLDTREKRRQKKFIKRYVAKNKNGFSGKFIQSFNELQLPLAGKRRHNKRHNRNSRRFTRSVDKMNLAISPVDASFLLQSSTLYDDAKKGLNPSNGNIDTTSEGGLSDEDTVHAFVAEEELRDLENQIIDISDELLILENITVNMNKDGNTEKVMFGVTESHRDCNFNDSLCHVETAETIDMWKNSKLALKDHILRLKQQLSVIKDIYIHLQKTQPETELFPMESIDDRNWNATLNDSNSDISLTLEKNTDLKIYFNNNRRYKPIKNEENLYTKSQLSRNNRKHHKKSNLKKLSYRNNPQKNPEGNVFDVDGMKLRPIPLNYLLNDFTKFSNEALSPVCWCDERVFLRLEMQKRRSLRRIERKKLKEERHRRRLARHQKKKQKLQWCAHPNLHCFAHDNNHWRTPPLWNDGSFCFCISASNNTYWCLRSITEEQNFLYCEFITGLVTYYDLHIDPYQLRNVAFTLSNDQVLKLHSKLTRLRTCSGKRECHPAEQFNNDVAYNENVDTNNNFNKETISSEHSNQVHPQNEVFLTQSVAKKNRRKKIKKLRRKLRRRLKKERKNKYAALLGMPESSATNNRKVKYSRKNVQKTNQKNKRKRHRQHRRKRKSKRRHSKLVIK